MANKWYFKTFRIYDSPDKDVPDETAVNGAFDTIVAKLFVRAHNKIVDELEDRIKELKAENKKLREILTREIDDGRAEVDDIGAEA